MRRASRISGASYSFDHRTPRGNSPRGNFPAAICPLAAFPRRSDPRPPGLPANPNQVDPRGSIRAHAEGFDKGKHGEYGDFPRRKTKVRRRPPLTIQTGDRPPGHPASRPTRPKSNPGEPNRARTENPKGKTREIQPFSPASNRNTFGRRFTF